MAAKYELVVVLKPDLNEAQAKDESKKIETVLTNEGAVSLAANFWGRKDLAYLVRKCRSGNFICYNYESSQSDTVKNVANVLRITDSVIKFQTHRLPDRKRKFKGNLKRAMSGEGGDEFGDSADENY